MITRPEYEAARKVVEEWLDQEYNKELDQAQRDFPIGTVIRDRIHDHYPIGPITSYFQLYHEVYFNIDAGGNAVGLISYKHAEKI